MSNTIKLTYSQWLKNYIPETDDENVIRDYSQLLPENPKQDNHIWTEVSGYDETTWILPGVHILNKIGIYYTEVPWDTEDMEVNCNTLVDINQAIEILHEFSQEYFSKDYKSDWEISDLSVSHFKVKAVEMLKSKEYNEGFIIISKLKYRFIDLIEDFFKRELSDEEIDVIDSYFDEKEFDFC